MRPRQRNAEVALTRRTGARQRRGLDEAVVQRGTCLQSRCRHTRRCKANSLKVAVLYRGRVGDGSSKHGAFNIQRRYKSEPCKQSVTEGVSKFHYFVFEYSQLLPSQSAKQAHAQSMPRFPPGVIHTECCKKLGGKHLHVTARRSKKQGVSITNTRQMTKIGAKLLNWNPHQCCHSTDQQEQAQFSALRYATS